VSSGDGTFGDNEEGMMLIQLGRSTDRRLRYPSSRFAMTYANLMQELVQVALTLLYVAPRRTTPIELVTGLYGPGLAPGEFRRSNPDDVALDAKVEMLQAMELATMMG
jgi:hypothetical protein